MLKGIIKIKRLHNANNQRYSVINGSEISIPLNVYRITIRSEMVRKERNT